MSIELRLSDVDPPAPDPPRTIYRDVLNLPDPVQLGLTIRYFNHDDVALYFQITASAAGYTFGTVNLGSLASGASAYRNLDNFGSRAKPSAGDFTDGEFEESVTLTLKAYTDAGYSDLKWTYEKTVAIYWIKSDDPAWTVDELDNFDDGTVQGWDVTKEAGHASAVVSKAVVTDYVLSAPYSCRMRHYLDITGESYGVSRSRLWKSFTTPDKPKVFAVLDLRTNTTKSLDTARGMWQKNVRVQKDGDILVFLGRPYDAVEGAGGDYFVRAKWFRVVTPLPRNSTIEVRIVHEDRRHVSTGYDGAFYVWLDDFKIISK